MYLESILNNSKYNNFNLIRLILSICVLYCHSFLIFDSNGYFDIVTSLFKFFDAGSLAVGSFFFISGQCCPVVIRRESIG